MVSRVGAREGVQFWSNYRTLFGKKLAWTNGKDPDQTPKNAASDQSLHCLPLIQQLYTHSQVVKWTIVKEKYKVKSKRCEYLG